MVPFLKNFLFISSAKSPSFDLQLVKILRVLDGWSRFQIRRCDLDHEIHASTFSHEAIVRMVHPVIKIDVETSRIANCRPGPYNALVYNNLK
jgi:hypothetical protein